MSGQSGIGKVNRSQERGGIMSEHSLKTSHYTARVMPAGRTVNERNEHREFHSVIGTVENPERIFGIEYFERKAKTPCVCGRDVRGAVRFGNIGDAAPRYVVCPLCAIKLISSGLFNETLCKLSER